jgi:precorrin-3B C17-methyltransferase
VTDASTPETAGWLAVVGLGPGDPGWLLPEAREVLSRATDLIGYQTYLDMLPPELRATQTLYGSDNGAELGRARHALELASSGRCVAVVSSGDPGVFAMASAVFEAQSAEDAPPAWQTIDVQVVPGVTAALATAARVGAPLGHDWCCISLSDNLKPWSIVERRLVAALDADFVLALYNPVSRHRPTRLADAFALIRARRALTTPIVLGRDVGRLHERVHAVPLSEVDLDECDMRTLIIVGSSTTRWGPAGAGGQRVFTPRWYPSDSTAH